MESFDVIVIGAGPAGSISSYYLSKQGLKVLLLDKKNLGKDKICGGGLSSYALNELPFKLPNTVIERNIKGCNFISPGNLVFTKKEAVNVGATVYRSIFDSYLIQKSIDSNTTFIPDTNIKKISKNGFFTVAGKYKSKYLIGADGANSVVKKAFNLGIKQKSKFIGLRTIIDFGDEGIDDWVLDTEAIDFYFENGFRGYGWVFPLKTSLNIGIDILGKSKTNINANLVRKFAINKFKLPKRLVTKSKIQGFPIPVSSLPKNFAKDDIFLIGDAAGLVDPVSAEGIHYAIKSGKIVADIIAKEKDQKNTLGENSATNYTKLIEKDIVADLRLGYKFRNFLDRFAGRNMEIWFKMMKRNPVVFDYVQQFSINGGYYSIYHEMLKHSPSLLLDTIKGNNTIPGFSLSKR